jgi:hypothetical protein
VVGKCERERGREGADGCGCGLRAFSTEGACCIVCFEICESARDSIGGLYI